MKEGEFYYEKLYPGKEVGIYLESDGNELIHEGDAILLEPADTWMEQVPFPYRDKPKQINLIKEKWRVRFKPQHVFDKGVVTDRWIWKFHSYGPIRINDSHPYEEFIQGFCVDQLGDAYLCDILKYDLRNKQETPLVIEFYKYVDSL